MPTTAKPTSLCPTIVCGRTTTVFRRPARPPPVSAVPARAPSTRFRSIPIITSPGDSTLMPALRIPTSPAVWPPPFLTPPASSITTTTPLLRQWVLGSPSDLLPRRCYDGRAPTVSLLGAALGGGGGDFRSTNMYMPNVHAIAAVHPARMSDG